MSTCNHCKKPLKESQYKNGKTLKSCPNCSQDNGNEHVYYKYPDEFGVTDLRSTASQPDGPQSYCTSCRGNNPPNSRPSTLCSQ